jgi:hypothetical protein
MEVHFLKDGDEERFKKLKVKLEQIFLKTTGREESLHP